MVTKRVMVYEDMEYKAKKNRILRTIQDILSARLVGSYRAVYNQNLTDGLRQYETFFVPKKKTALQEAL